MLEPDRAHQHASECYICWMVPFRWCGAFGNKQRGGVEVLARTGSALMRLVHSARGLFLYIFVSAAHITHLRRREMKTGYLCEQDAWRSHMCTYTLHTYGGAESPVYKCNRLHMYVYVKLTCVLYHFAPISSPTGRRPPELCDGNKCVCESKFYSKTSSLTQMSKPCGCIHPWWRIYSRRYFLARFIFILTARNRAYTCL